jgi:hypothetical protein
MIEKISGANLKMSLYGSRSRVVCSVDKPSNARMDYRARAHRARLYGRKESRARQSIIARRESRLAQGDDFGVRGRIARLYDPVMTAPHYAPFEDDDCADRDFARQFGASSFFNSFAHKKEVAFFDAHNLEGSQGFLALCGLRRFNLFSPPRPISHSFVTASFRISFFTIRERKLFIEIASHDFCRKGLSAKLRSRIKRPIMKLAIAEPVTTPGSPAPDHKPLRSREAAAELLSKKFLPPGRTGRGDESFSAIHPCRESACLHSPFESSVETSFPLDVSQRAFRPGSNGHCLGFRLPSDDHRYGQPYADEMDADIYKDRTPCVC